MEDGDRLDEAPTQASCHAAQAFGFHVDDVAGASQVVHAGHHKARTSRKQARSRALAVTSSNPGNRCGWLQVGKDATDFKTSFIHDTFMTKTGRTFAVIA